MRHQTRRLAFRRQFLAVAPLHGHQRLARGHGLGLQLDHDQFSVALLSTHKQIVSGAKRKTFSSVRYSILQDHVAIHLQPNGVEPGEVGWWRAPFSCWAAPTPS